MTKQITKLTEEQEDLIPVIRDRWLNKIYNKLDKKQAKENIEWLYELTGHKKPIVWLFSSPFALQIVANLLKQSQGANIRDNIGANIRANIGANIRENIRDNIGANIRANIRDNIGDNIWDNIWANIGANIRANIRENIRDNIGANIGANIRANIRDNIRENIGANIRDNIGENKLDFFHFASYGNISDYGWLANAEYYNEAKLLTYTKQQELNRLIKYIDSGIYDCLQFNNICLACENPIKLKRNNQMRLHADGESAIAWADGYECFYLNGVRVPEYLAITPSGKLDLELWKKETNADIRTEFRNKYGVDRMKQLGEVIDSYKNYKNLNLEWKKSKYELIDMSKIFNGLDYAPHLNMVNLTTGITHLEPVAPACKTIQDAINFRWEEDSDSYETISIK